MTFDNFSLNPDQLIKIRKELYSPTGPGYYVFKNFIPENFVKHIRSFWTNEAPKSKQHQVLTDPFDKSKIFYRECPNYFYETPYGRAYYNYFWNQPIDEVSHAVSFSVNYLRNLIESSNNYNFFYPITGNCCSYRVVTTLTGSPVKPHTDWTEGEYFVPKRLQATLFITKKGIDYSGEGMKMLSNDKTKRFIFDDDIILNPGDLVIWRYNNEHSVENISTSEGQAGFVRLIFPPEIIVSKPKELILSELTAKELMAGLLKKINNRISKK